jgi:GcrA cell cycle regulator
MRGTFEWTPARVQNLREAWAAGQTVAVIARAFRIGRGSVIGKVHRLGLARRAVSKRPTKAAAPQPAKSAAARNKPAATKQAVSLASSPAIPLVRSSQRMPPVAADAAGAKKSGRAVPAVAGAASLRPPPPQNGCGILDLTNETCRWPRESCGLGDPRYCGEPGAGLSARRPYCAAHTRLTYVPSPRPRQRGRAS